MKTQSAIIKQND